MTRNRRAGLTDFEVSLIKGMMKHQMFRHDQDILVLFSRPGRTVNNGRLSEIRAALEGRSTRPAVRRFMHQPVATREEVEQFLASRPPVDPRTGLDLDKDELVLKAREAMLLAVQAYNNPTCYFRSEIFIVSAIIAWTYLLLSFFQSKNIDCIHRNKDGTPFRTKGGQERHLELRALLAKPECPLSPPMKKNLEYLLELRHEIEHRGTGRIDHAVSAKLQACALNFNSVLKDLFGLRCGLDQELSIAIQFARLDPIQRRAVAGSKGLPKLIETFNLAFEQDLPPEVLSDPAYAYRVAIVPHTVNRPGQADEAFELVDPESAEGRKIALVLKDREKPKFLPKQIIRMMREAGYAKFNMHHHTQLWKRHDAKNPAKGFGVEVAGTWYWYENWIEFVRKHCEEAGDRYRQAR